MGPKAFFFLIFWLRFPLSCKVLFGSFSLSLSLSAIVDTSLCSAHGHALYDTHIMLVIVALRYSDN